MSNLAVSLPVQNSNLSHWQRTTRSFPHLNANQFETVPARTPYLVIGSGLTGALAAWELINSGVDAKDVVIIEAREAVSGATGRNAGHCRPDAFRGFPRFAAIHGPEQSRRIIESEKIVLQNVKSFIESNRIDCDFYCSTTLEVCIDQSYADFCTESIAQFHAAGGDTSHIKYYEGKEAKEISKVPTAICVYEWPAASVHPSKLTQWILNDIITKGAQLWTHCPVTKVEKHRSNVGMKWDATTPRGVIAARTILHCTNAYAAYLLPELAGVVTPRRAQGHSYVPPDSLSGHNTLKSTMSLRYAPKHFFSVNQLKDGTIVFGGAASRCGAEQTPEFMRDRFTFDDSRHNPVMQSNSISEFQKLAYGSPVKCPERAGEGFAHVWTGIIGETPDAVPLIGPIEGLDGQWICAGFNGHGMGRIFQCAPGIIKLLKGKPWSLTGMPECFYLSKQRLDRFSPVKTKA
ncbi:FAD dependent oxidoreductase [Trichoderma velutinum]